MLILVLLALQWLVPLPPITMDAIRFDGDDDMALAVNELVVQRQLKGATAAGSNGSAWNVLFPIQPGKSTGKYVKLDIRQQVAISVGGDDDFPFLFAAWVGYLYEGWSRSGNADDPSVPGYDATSGTWLTGATQSNGIDGWWGGTNTSTGYASYTIVGTPTHVRVKLRESASYTLGCTLSFRNSGGTEISAVSVGQATVGTTIRIHPLEWVAIPAGTVSVRVYRRADAGTVLFYMSEIEFIDISTRVSADHTATGHRRAVMFDSGIATTNPSAVLPSYDLSTRPEYGAYPILTNSNWIIPRIGDAADSDGDYTFGLQHFNNVPTAHTVTYTTGGSYGDVALTTPDLLVVGTGFKFRCYGGVQDPDNDIVATYDHVVTITPANIALACGITATEDIRLFDNILCELNLCVGGNYEWPDTWTPGNEAARHVADMLAVGGVASTGDVAVNTLNGATDRLRLQITGTGELATDSSQFTNPTGGDNYVAELYCSYYVGGAGYIEIGNGTEYTMGWTMFLGAVPPPGIKIAIGGPAEIDRRRP